MTPEDIPTGDVPTLEALVASANALRRVVLMTQARGGRIEPFELDMVRTVIAQIDCLEEHIGEGHQVIYQDA